MKAFRLFVLCFGSAAIIAGCQRPEPEAPKLIAPADGASFDTIPPTLIWSACNPEGKYIVLLNVSAGAVNKDVSNLVSDTTYILTFEGIEYVMVKWCVGVEVDTGTLWSESRTFYIDARKNVPDLILPEDGAVFDSLPPAFVWSKEDVSEYYLMIYKDSFWNKNALMCNTLHDTTFSLSTEDIIWNNIGTYVWTVMVKDTLNDSMLYSKPQIFKIDDPLLLDLDTTYFPFDVGHKWKYLRHNQGYDKRWGWDYDETYEYTVEVIRSFPKSRKICFELQFEPKNGGMSPSSLFDFDDTVQAFKDSIILNFAVDKTVHLVPSEISVPFSITYHGDTLCISNSGGNGTYFTSTSLQRLKGIGLINQESSYQEHSSSEGYIAEGAVYDHLLWFYNGKDTIYKAP